MEEPYKPTREQIQVAIDRLKYNLANKQVDNSPSPADRVRTLFNQMTLDAREMEEQTRHTRYIG